MNTFKPINTNLGELSARYTQARKDQPFTPRAANLLRDCLLYIKDLETKSTNDKGNNDELQSTAS